MTSTHAPLCLVSIVQASFPFQGRKPTLPQQIHPNFVYLRFRTRYCPWAVNKKTSDSKYRTDPQTYVSKGFHKKRPQTSGPTLPCLSYKSLPVACSAASRRKCGFSAPKTSAAQQAVTSANLDGDRLGDDKLPENGPGEAWGKTVDETCHTMKIHI